MAKKTSGRVTYAKIDGRWQPVLVESLKIVSSKKLGINEDQTGYETIRGVREAVKELNKEDHPA